MPGREQPETPTTGPRADFAERLRQLRSGQGLTLRALASRSGYTQASLSAVEQGRLAPSWEVIEAFVRTCGSDPGHWRRLWEAAGDAPSPESAIPESGDVCAHGVRRWLRGRRAHR
jgi:transcriptional regulator with XRE-family HTH domain